jgi:hypothetical protein
MLRPHLSSAGDLAPYYDSSGSYITTSSVSNGSEQSVWVRDWVGTELEPAQPSGYLNNLNCQFGLGLIDICLPVWIGRVLSRLCPRGHPLIHITCLLLLFDFSNKSKLIISHPAITSFKFCVFQDRQYLIHVFLLMICIFTIEEGNCSVVSSNIRVIGSLSDLHHQHMMTLSWRWGDGYCQNGAMTMALSLVRILGGNTSVMDSS